MIVIQKSKTVAVRCFKKGDLVESLNTGRLAIITKINLSLCTLNVVSLNDGSEYTWEARYCKLFQGEAIIKNKK